ncbi:unnamed protein product [Arabidopsis lyrata]|nr:unnamed protein product [Arabidopsis lyrata]
MLRFDRTYMPLLLMKLELKIRSLCGLNKPKCIECGNVAPASRHTMQETYGYRFKARGQLLSLFFEKTQLLVFSVKYVLHAFVASQPQPTAPANTQAANATTTNTTATANAPATAPTGTVAATTTPSSSF